MAELPEQAAFSGRFPPSVSRRWWTRAMTVQVVILAVILGAHYRHVIERLVMIWSRNGDWSHGFIIPLFSLYYLYLQRHRMPVGLQDRGIASRLVGAGLLVLAFTVYVYCTLSRIEYPKSVALVMSVMGVVLMTCGWPWARWSWFAVAFLLFALPLPTRLYVQLTMPLRFIAAQVSAAMLSLLPEMEAEARGTVVDYIYQGRVGMPLDIERACSGIRLLITMMALGVAMAFVSERPLWHRLVMILSCVPIAVFCNIIRVTSTGFMVVLGREELARGFWHTMLGLGMLFIAFSLYGGISYVLNHLLVEPELEHETRTSHAVTGGASE
jgi:exosortase